jgi:hypothetical protein
MDVALGTNPKIRNPSNIHVSLAECRAKSQHKQGNELMENLVKSEYVGMTVANNDCTFRSGSTCYNSFQKLLPSDLLLKTEIFKINIKAVTLLSFCSN